MIKFLIGIYKRILQLDNYTRAYQKISNNIELPYIAYTNWGLHFADIKDFDGAVEKLETASNMFGQNPRPCTSLGVIYAKLKEYDKAIAALKEAIRRDSNNAYAHSVLSGVYVALDKFEEAETMLKKAVKLSPADSEVYLNYGIFYAKTQKKLKAIEMFKKSQTYNPDNLHAAFLLGVMYFETGKISEAFNEFKNIEKINPDYKKLNYYLSLCYQKEKNYTLAADYGEKALEEEPHNPAVYVSLAHTFVRMDKKEDTLNLYKLGEERNINDFDFFLSEGIVYTRFNDIEHAKNCIKKALNLQKNNSSALYRMGVCLRKEGNYEEAIKYYNLAVEADVNNSYALNDLGMLKYDKGNYKEAIRFLFKAINASKDKNYLYFYIANSYYKLGRLKKSVEFYEKTIEYYPNHLEALLNCTICLLYTNNAKEALRKIRNAYQINRNSAKVVLLYALTDLECGIYSDVIEKTDILLSKNPDNSDAKLIKAHALINMKEAQKALDILNSVEENIRNTEIFIFLSYLVYKILVEENPSDYNKSMYDLYLKKMNDTNSDLTDKNGLISYIVEK